MYITKKEAKILDDLMWYASECGMFDKDHSAFLDINKIDEIELSSLRAKLMPSGRHNKSAYNIK